MIVLAAGLLASALVVLAFAVLFAFGAIGMTLNAKDAGDALIGLVAAVACSTIAVVIVSSALPPLVNLVRTLS